MKKILPLVALVMLAGCPDPQPPSPSDSGVADSGVTPQADAGEVDAGRADAGESDGGTTDAGVTCVETGCAAGQYCADSGECEEGCDSDTACPKPGGCNLATNACECAAGTRLCGTSCVAESAASCGAACTVCSASEPDAYAVCVEGSCGERCMPGYLRCGGACVDAATAPFALSANATEVPSMSRPLMVLAEDVDEDGWPDLVASSSYGATPRQTVALLNLRDGGFATPVTLVGRTGESVLFEDMNGDGRRDLSVSAGDTIEIFHKTGDTQYAPGSALDGGYYFAVGELTGDTRPEVVTIQGGKLRTYSQSSSGVFVLSDVQDAYHMDPLVTLGDVDGDGLADAVYATGASADAGWTGGGISLHKGLNNGAFMPGVAFAVATKVPTTLRLADLDGDAHLDAVYSLYNTGTTGLSLAYRPGKGDGSFLAERSIASGVPQVTYFTVADVNGDLQPDLLIPSGYGYVGVYLNDQGTFTKYRDLPAANVEAHVADFNGDELPDVLVADDDGFNDDLGIYWGQCSP